MTVKETLLAISPYPIPEASLEAFGTEVGLGLEDEAGGDVRALNGAKARLYFWLATTPNVSEGGVSISFSAADKALFLKKARWYAEQAGEDGLIPAASYGYKGENI